MRVHVPASTSEHVLEFCWKSRCTARSSKVTEAAGRCRASERPQVRGPLRPRRPRQRCPAPCPTSRSSLSHGIGLCWRTRKKSRRPCSRNIETTFQLKHHSITPACPLVKARLSIQTMINRPFTSNDRTTICFNFQYSRKPAALLCFPNDELLSIFPRVTHERVKKRRGPKTSNSPAAGLPSTPLPVPHPPLAPWQTSCRNLSRDLKRCLGMQMASWSLKRHL